MKPLPTSPPSRPRRWRRAGGAALALALCALTTPGTPPLSGQAQARLRKTLDLPPDLELISRSPAGFVTVRVADLLDEGLFRKLPEPVRDGLLSGLTSMARSFDLKPTEVERLSFQIPSGGPLVFLQTAKGYSRDKVLKALRLDAKETKIKGKSVYLDARRHSAFHPVNDRLFVMGTDRAVKQLLESDGSKTPDKLHLEAVNLAAGKHHVVLSMARGDLLTRTVWYMRPIESNPGSGPPNVEVVPAENEKPLPKEKEKARTDLKDGPPPDKQTEVAFRARPDPEPKHDEPEMEMPTLDDLFGEPFGAVLLPFKPLLAAKYGWMTFDLGGETKLDTKLTFDADDGARDGETAVKTLFYVMREGVPLWLTGEFGAQPSESPKLAAALKQVQDAFRKAVVKREDAVVRSEVRLKVEAKDIASVMQELEKLGSRKKAFNDLSQLAIAMHNYESTLGALPGPAIYDGPGKPLLSWRVAILPFIEQDHLYKRFKLDEPWDSANNKKLLEKMPKVFAPAQGKTKQPYMTYYQVFVGPDAIFDPATTRRGPVSNGRRLATITDGTSNTLMIVEGAEPVPWTKPDDIPFDAKKAPPKLGGVFADGFHAAFADGGVYFIKKSIDPKVLTALITPAGGEAVDWSKWDATPRRMRPGRYSYGSSGTASGTGVKVKDAPPPPPPPPKDKP
jgi:hypothetical protein